uniref:neuroguidin-like n=1 Tax=Styela clava TaxID=7725 RepID=UPI001939EA70|nr:neuroguidin-like [Styela clava]
MDNIDKLFSELIAKDVPALEDLLKMLSTEAQSMTEFVDTLLQRLDENELPTEGGVSLLDVKYHSLLSYIIDLVFVTIKKIQGENIADCHAKNRLVENRTVLEKLNPLEHKIKYQIDKLLQQSTQNLLNDPLSLKPNIDNLESKIDNDESGNSDDEQEPKKYVPPRIAASHYDVEDGKSEQEDRRSRERALKRSSIIMDLAQETSDAPFEISEYSAGRKRVQKERAERTTYEEANLIRINLTKKQKNAERQLMRRSELDTITKFGDIGVLEGRQIKNNNNKRKSTGKYNGSKKWKKFRK